MQITVNGITRDITDGMTLADLLRELALASARVAIEHNRAVVRRADWPQTFLAAGDNVEIVHFVGGGAC